MHHCALQQLQQHSSRIGWRQVRRLSQCCPARAAGSQQGNGTGAANQPASSSSSSIAAGSNSRTPPRSAQQAAQQLQQQQLQQYRQEHPQPTRSLIPMQQFDVESETAVHQRYLTVYNRKVRFCAHERPTECHTLEFDVVGHPRANFSFSVTFPFHPYKDGRKGGEVTLIREYAQGPNALMYCLPTGALDPQRHADLQECAARELSEEAWLAGGEWQRLLPADHPGLPEVKWCMNRFVPFLAVDPQPDLNPGSRDAEEASMEVLRVPLEEFKSLMLSGDMLLPSITTAYLAMDRLREQGLL